jgi:carboxypeptidase family protein
MRAVSTLLKLQSMILVMVLVVPGAPSWAQDPQPSPDQPPQVAPPPEAPPPDSGEKGEERAPAAEQKAAPAKAGAALRGRVFGSDRKTPVPGAVVHAVRPDGTVTSSAPADAKGNYVLEGIPPGTYSLAVSKGSDVYSLESPIGVTSAHTFSVDLATVPATAAASIPGVDGTPRGFCYIVQGKKPEGTSFWRSPKGIIVLASTAGAIGLLLAASGKSNDEESPVSPSAP